MNIALSSTSAVNFHVLLEQTETGRIIASIAELANSQVEADTRHEALQAIQQLVSDRLSNVEVLPIEVGVTVRPLLLEDVLQDQERENPWTEFVGMFEDDAEFAEMAAQWRSEREDNANDGI